MIKKLTTKELYFLIRSLEFDAGEGLFDCNMGENIIRNTNFAFWAYGKKLFDIQGLNYILSRDESIIDMLTTIDKYSPYINMDYLLDDYLVVYTLCSCINNIAVCMHRLQNTFISHDCPFEINLNLKEQLETEIDSIQPYIKKYNL